MLKYCLYFWQATRQTWRNLCLSLSLPVRPIFYSDNQLEGPIGFLITVQKMKFSNKDFFSECDQIRRKFLLKSLMENFIFCAVTAMKLQWSTAQKMRFSITDFFSQYDQISSFLRIRSHLPKKSVMINLIFLCSKGVAE